jgi:hypothetical protein
MKVLTHAGVLVTMPFTMGRIGVDEFELMEGNGTTEVGVVAEMSESDVRRLVNGTAKFEQSLLEPREILKEVQFIARMLYDVPLGTEIRLRSGRKGRELVIPPEAMPEQEPVEPGDRIAVNHRVRPKAWMNCHGVVKAVKGDKADVMLDEGDRRRVARATGKELGETVKIPVALLDRLESKK